MKVTILGAGAFGSALGSVLEENYHAINYYDPIKLPNLSLDSAIKGSDIIILATPSSAAYELLPKLPEDTPLICATKGLLSIEPFKNFKNFSVISGGTFAEDLINKVPTKITVTSKLPEKLFKTNWLSCDHTDDAEAVLICGSIKNIYAIGAGLKNLQPGSKAEKEYIYSSVNELRVILAANNHDPEIAELACGKNDLALTCASSNSRNRAYGVAIANGEKLPENTTVEGLSTIKALKESTVILPPLTILDNIIQEVQNATK